MNPRFDLIEAVYAAAEGSRSWASFLHELSETMRSGPTAFLMHDFRDQLGSISAIVNLDEKQREQFESYYSVINPWMQPEFQKRFTPGKVRLGVELVSHERVRATEFYQDFGRSNAVAHCVGGVILQDEDRIATIAVNAGDDREPFDVDDRRELEALMPHLSHAIRWQAAQQAYEKTRGILDELPHAVWEVDAKGRPLSLNAAAQRLIEEGSAFTLQRGVLKVRVADEWQPVSAYFHQPPAPVAWNRYLLTTRPMRLDPGAFWVLRHAGHLVTAAEIGAPSAERIEKAARLFGLTVAEARLVAVLLPDTTLAQAAGKLGVSYNTAKTQLAAVFGKTNTRKQSELASLVISTARLL